MASLQRIPQFPLPTDPKKKHKNTQTPPPPAPPHLPPGVPTPPWGPQQAPAQLRYSRTGRASGTPPPRHPGTRGRVPVPRATVALRDPAGTTPGSGWDLWVLAAVPYHFVTPRDWFPPGRSLSPPPPVPVLFLLPCLSALFPPPPAVEQGINGGTEGIRGKGTQPPTPNHTQE